MRTVRARCNDRQVARNAADADVQETAEHKTGDEDCDGRDQVQALLEYVLMACEGRVRY